MKAALRPYQVEAIEQIRAAIRAGKRRILLTVPTGGGKTLTAASMIAGALARGKRSQFVAHRKELIDQTVTAFARLGITSVGVVRAGDKRRDPSQPIQVSSIQTLANRTQQDFDLVFVDEAHRSNAKTYLEHVFARHKRAIIIGLSATPCRGDGKPLDMFDELIVGAKYSELIAGGYLAAPLGYSTPMLPDLSTVRTTAGEYNQADLEDAVNRGALIGDLYTQWAKHPPARTVAFAVSVAHSRAIVGRFVAEGVRAEHLDGTTPEDERAAILARLASGETTLVSNVGVLCEGWDLPSCKRLIVARPTKSLALWLQMAGRILRPHDGEIPIILDHGDNWDRHGAPHQDQEWSLTAKPKRIGVAPSRVCEGCFGHILASARTCPLCGAAQPEPAAPERDPAQDVIVDLALRSLSAVGDLGVVDPVQETRLEKFRGFYLVARERGWMPGAVVHRYRELLGEEPPASWVSALKSDYRNDGVWKAAVAQRKRERDRPEFCACGCGVEVPQGAREMYAITRRGGRPWMSKACRQRAFLAGLTPEQRSEYDRQRARTPEQMAETARRAYNALAPEQKAARVARMNAAITPEQRKANGRAGGIAANGASTHEQQVEYGRMGAAARWKSA